MAELIRKSLSTILNYLVIALPAGLTLFFLREFFHVDSGTVAVVVSIASLAISIQAMEKAGKGKD